MKSIFRIPYFSKKRYDLKLAEIALEDENNVLECGININVQPPGKKLQNMLLFFFLLFHKLHFLLCKLS